MVRRVQRVLGTVMIVKRLTGGRGCIRYGNPGLRRGSRIGRRYVSQPGSPGSNGRKVIRAAGSVPINPGVTSLASTRDETT